MPPYLMDACNLASEFARIHLCTYNKCSEISRDNSLESHRQAGTMKQRAKQKYGMCIPWHGVYMRIMCIPTVKLPILLHVYTVSMSTSFIPVEAVGLLMSAPQNPSTLHRTLRGAALPVLIQPQQFKQRENQSTMRNEQSYGKTKVLPNRYMCKGHAIYFTIKGSTQLYS